MTVPTPEECRIRRTRLEGLESENIQPGKVAVVPPAVRKTMISTLTESGHCEFLYTQLGSKPKEKEMNL